MRSIKVCFSKKFQCPKKLRMINFSPEARRRTGHILLARFSRGSSSDLSIPRREKVPWSEDNQASKNDPHAYDLAGTSVSRGRFFFDEEPRHYAVGAPKAWLPDT